jgi:hypothetical protein
MSVARERLGKHVPAEMDTRMNVVDCGSVPRTVIRKTTGATNSVLYGSLKKRGSCKGAAIQRGLERGS